MKKMLSMLDRGLSMALVGLLSALVIAIVWQVLSRYLLGAPAAFTEEIARFLLIWISLLGASYAFRTRMHLGLDLVTAQLNGRKRQLAEFAALIAVMCFAIAVMVIGGTRLVLLTAALEQHSAVMGIGMCWVYSVIPLSGTLMVIYAIDAINALWNLADNPNDALQTEALSVVGGAAQTGNRE